MNEQLLILAVLVGTLAVCCSALTQEESLGSLSAPPRNPPDLEEYTLSGRIPVEYLYVDDSNQGKGTNYSYGSATIHSYIESARRQLNHLRSSGDVSMNHLHKKYWPMFAMMQYEDKIYGKRVAVFGSIDPYIEAIAIALGAVSVVTFEINQISFDSDAISTTPYEAAFDVALSFSSFDHTGLGRYGDELDPLGDVHAMLFAKHVMKRGGEGIFMLTVPIGPDVLVWNLHRRYGSVRLPLLLEGFHEVERLGWQEDLLIEPANWRQTYEPIFVLTV
eukprot:GSChrysophyteH1.ASY1.ANO1.2030.1 assembled CDS